MMDLYMLMLSSTMGLSGVGSPVPEPATWLSLMIGFFAIGFGLRGGMTSQPLRRSNGLFVQ